MPFTRNFLHYETKPGVVKHFYGFHFALGGIISIKAGDFEKINGFPNFWAWGYEDNMLNKRVEAASGLTIDRSQFYPIADKNIMQFNDGLGRNINRNEFDRYMDNTKEGIDSIFDLEYDIDPLNGFINVSRFETTSPENIATRKTHDIRKGNQPYLAPIRAPSRRIMSMNLSISK